MVDNSNFLQGKLAEMQRWLHSAKVKQTVHDLSVKDINKRINARLLSVKDYGYVNISLECLAVWNKVAGILSIYSDNTEGWQQAQNGLLLECCSTRISLYQYDHDNRPDKGTCGLLINDVNLLLAQALATGNWEIADWLGTRIIQALDDGAFGSWELNPFEPFMASLFAKYKGISLDLEHRQVRGYPVCSLRHYADVFSAWDDVQRLSDVLVHACDYHIKRSAEPDDEDTPEFNNYPYPIFPVEILAVQKIRQQMQLPVPEVNHPLMQTPLARPPEIPPVVQDPLLDAVIARARRDFPGI